MSPDSVRDLARRLRAEVPAALVRESVPLASISRWKIGGPVDILVDPDTTQCAARVMEIVNEVDIPFHIMGDGSNTLFDDQGFRGVIMRIGRNLSRIEVRGSSVWAQAGVWAPRFSLAVSDAGLSGIEHTIGIPGTLGGLITMNGGSQRKGIGLNVVELLCADERGHLFTMSKADCEFGYRSSRLQHTRAVVLEATLEFERGVRAEIRRQMLSIMRDRRRKFPQSLPNCGSTFLSDPTMYQHIGPPGQAIEAAGLKGMRMGGAYVSELHANFIVNAGEATSEDVLSLIGHVRSTVRNATGYEMDCEVRHLSPEGRLQPAHVPAEELLAKIESGAVRR